MYYLFLSAEVSDSCNPRVCKNTVRNGLNGGIVVHGKATGEFMSNSLCDNAQVMTVSMYIHTYIRVYIRRKSTHTHTHTYT